MRFLLIMAMLYSSVLVANDVVAHKIDTALEFANAGRADLALQQFQKLLQTTLTPVEKATILYNSAVIFATSDRYWDAMLALDQIDDDMFDKVVAASPLEAVQIAYNGAFCAAGFAKNEMLKLVAANTYTQKELDHIAQALNSAVEYSKKLDNLVQKKVIGDVALSSFIARTQLQEDIANVTSSLARFQQLLMLEQLDKTVLLDELGGLLQQQFSSALNLYVANGSGKDLYMQVWAKEDVGNILFCIDRLRLYLQAPAKKQVAGMHAFLASELQVLSQSLNTSYYNGDIVQALKELDLLSTMVLLLQSEATKSEVATLLDVQIGVAMNYLLLQKLAQFWQNQWQVQRQFLAQFLAKKALFLDQMGASLVALLQKKIESEQAVEPDVQQAEDTAFYWKILTQPENKTYTDLAVTLHAAAKVDYSQLTKTVHALLDRVDVLQVPQAKPPLAAMLATESAVLLFQDVIESWFYVEPQEALRFILGLLSDECSALHVNPSMDSFTARTDYHLVMHLLSLFLKSDDKGIIASVYSDLKKKGHWFTDKEKKDLDFFTISLELGWLKEMLTNQVENLEGITNAVDFGVDFQKKTMSLLRYAVSPEFQPALDLLSQMQQHLTHAVNSALNNLSSKGPKIQQVIKLVGDAETQTKTQNKELASMQAVQDDLEQASKILHSMKSESQSQSQESKASQAPEPSSATEQMQKQALKLAPEISIRLLQEMEQEDKSLQTQNIPQVSGTRPW